MTLRIGVDTGGTFTDVVLYDGATGRVRTAKTPSTPPAFDRGVLEGIDRILERADADGSAVDFLGHGTTVGTNAVLEGEIPRLGLITNEGLRDVLEIGDQTRPELYNLQTDKPPALIPRYLRKEVPGRIDSRGREVDPLDEDRARAVVDELVAEDPESVVVSMLFSYLDGSHERRVGELIEEHHPGMEYTLSADVHPEIREYERTITTVLNEAIKTTIREYFARLDDGIGERGIEVPMTVMHSGGGIFGTRQATEYAIRTVLSGPAAGSVAVRHVCEREGYSNAIGMDMGGTSADVSLIRDGDLVRSTDGEIANLPLNTPMIDITTVGAGGGSIAWIDDGGALRVGPKSAGAEPGPICYDRGGDRPTVTDANLLLGRLNPDNFLAGEMDLAVERTRSRFAETIAEPLGLSIEAAAHSVIEVANASLSREIRRVTVERGDDPEEFALVAFGGAGPLQAAATARKMDMGTVIVPTNPGVLSAHGLLLADVRVDESHAYRDDRIDPVTVAEQFDTLVDRLKRRIREQGLDPADARFDRTLDMRYRGQSYELSVDHPPGPVDGGSIESAIASFHDTHARRYGHAMADEPVELVTLRVAGLVPTPSIDDTTDPAGGDAYRGEREVYFAETGFEMCDSYDRSGLSPGDGIDGPAIVEEAGSTTVIPPETSLEVSEYGSLIVSI